MSYLTSLPELGDYTFIGSITTGILAGCWKAFNKKSQETFCIRSIPKAAISAADQYSKFSNQLTLLKQLDNKYIATFIELIEDAKTYHIVTELPEGMSLHDYITKNGPMPEKLVIEMIARLFYIIHYIMHYIPLNYDNVYIDGTGHLTRYIYPVDDFLSDQNNLGRLSFNPLEMISSKKPHINTMSWSMASVAYYAMNSKLPFSGSSEEEMTKSILSSRIEIPTSISPEAQIFFEKGFVKNPLMRSSVVDLFVTDFLKGAYLETSSTNERRCSAQIPQQKNFLPLKKLPSFSTTPSMDFNDTSAFSKKAGVKLSYKSNIVAMKSLRSSNVQLSVPLG